MSTPRSWSRGSGRQVDEVGWSRKVTEMGGGTDKDKKGKEGGCTMTHCFNVFWQYILILHWHLKHSRLKLENSVKIFDATMLLWHLYHVGLESMMALLITWISKFQEQDHIPSESMDSYCIPLCRLTTSWRGATAKICPALYLWSTWWCSSMADESILCELECWSKSPAHAWASWYDGRAQSMGASV